MDVPVRIVGVFEVENADNPFVLLRDEQARNFLIWIGPCEALAIQTVLTGTMPARPLSHDLMLTLLERLGATLERIVIDDFSNGVFYCKLYLHSATGEMQVDCRPSDGMALALRAQAPVFAAEEVIEAVKVEQDIEIPDEEQPAPDEDAPEGSGPTGDFPPIA